MTDPISHPKALDLDEQRANFHRVMTALCDRFEADQWARLVALTSPGALRGVMGIAGEIGQEALLEGYKFGRDVAAEGTLAWVLELLDQATLEGRSAMEVAEDIRQAWPAFHRTLTS